jgi:hypothetical protein
MGVQVRYRIEVSAVIQVEQRFAYLFNGKTNVPRGTYDITINAQHISKERDIQALARKFGGVVKAKIARTFMEQDNERE